MCIHLETHRHLCVGAFSLMFAVDNLYVRTTGYSRPTPVRKEEKPRTGTSFPVSCHGACGGCDKEGVLILRWRDDYYNDMMMRKLAVMVLCLITGTIVVGLMFISLVL